MSVSSKLQSGFNKILDRAGDQIRIRYYDISTGSVWDDDTTLTQSGTDLWTSGVIQAIKSVGGSSESVLMEEGKLTNADKRLYLFGTVATTGSIQKFDVQIGSPSGDLYTSIPDGATLWEAQGSPIYKKQFIRLLTGSLT